MWTLPDKGEAFHDNQSILFQEYLDVVIAAFGGSEFVIGGCGVTAQGLPDMTVAVAAGAVNTNYKPKTVSAGNVTITAADATNPRFDLIVANSAGTKAARAGTPAANPKPPARTANDVVLAVVYVPANDTTIASNQIVDLRVQPQEISISLESDFAVTSSTVAEVTGLTIPTDVGTFIFEYSMRVQSATATVSMKAAVDHSGTTTEFEYRFEFPSQGVTAANGVIDQETNATTGFILAQMSTRVKNTTLGPMTDVDTINADIMLVIKGRFICTVAGNLKLMYASETATSTTLKAGTALKLTRVG